MNYLLKRGMRSYGCTKWEKKTKERADDFNQIVSKQFCGRVYVRLAFF